MTFDEAEAALITLVEKHKSVRREYAPFPAQGQWFDDYLTGVEHLEFTFASVGPFADVPARNPGAPTWVKFSRRFSNAWEALDFMVLREQCGFVTTSPADFKEAGFASSVGRKLTSTDYRYKNQELVVVTKGLPLRYQLTEVGRIVHTFCSYFEPLTPFRVAERMLRAKVPPQI